MKKLLCLLFAAIFLSGCVTTSTNLYKDNQNYISTDPESVKIFKQMPEDIKFTKIGEVTVDKARNWNIVEENLKKEGAKIGADAVYIIDTQTTQVGYVSGYSHGAYGVSNGYVSGGSHGRFTVTGVAVKYQK